MSNTFIAPKIKVGFQERSDTFTGMLAYIIYYDNKGALRKEKSWESWRDKKIDPIEFENVPTEGFTLNKDIKRYHGGWFSSNRTMIRVHDPRGFEFEVTTENLIGILMHTDCLKRGLIGKFVYAWMGTELVLLPTNSEEYQAATRYTSGLSKKVTSKDIKEGLVYRTKKGENVTYLGKHKWYRIKNSSNSCYIHRLDGPVTGEVFHIFTNDDGKSFFRKDSLSFLSEPVTDSVVPNFAELIEKYGKQPYAAEQTLELRLLDQDDIERKFTQLTKNPYSSEDRGVYFVESLQTPGLFREIRLTTEYRHSVWDQKKQQYVSPPAELVYDGYKEGEPYLYFNNADKSFSYLPKDHSERYRRYYSTTWVPVVSDTKIYQLYTTKGIPIKDLAILCE